MFFSENDLTLEILGVFKINRGKYNLHASRERNYDSISIRTDGVGCLKCDREEYCVKKGSVLYIPHNTTYSQHTDGETVYAVHFLNYNFNAKNKIELLECVDSEKVEKTLKEMYGFWRDQKKGYRFKCTELLYSLLYMLNNQAQSVYSEDFSKERLKKAVNYIHTNFRSQNISCDELAEMSVMSQTYFRRVFKNVYGNSPVQYIIKLRLEYSKQLLSSNLYTVSEVSDKAGFSDPKYFSKVFKKYYGYSPKQYSMRRGI